MAHNAWLTLCLFTSCYFFGASLNPILVLPGLLGPLGVLATTPSHRFAQLQQATPLVFWGCLAASGLLAVHHLVLSISPGTSFIPSIVLACLPLWILTVAVLENPRQLWVFSGILIACFATLSVFEFLVDRQRAHAPLVDPGNYLTLLYLAWIPWLVAALVKPLRGSSLWLLFAFAALFTIAMLATHLRFAMLVLLGMAVVIVWLCFRLGKQWRTGGMAIAGIAVGSALYLLLDPSGAASSFDDAGALGTGAAQQSPRLLLWQAAWEAVKVMGGINGTGIGTFTQIYPIFRSPAEQSTAGVLVHNDLLQLLLEGGIWLFVPMVLLCVAIGLAAVAQLFLQTVPRREAGLFLALSVAVVHATVNFVFYVLPLVIVFAIALAMALVVYPRNAASASWQSDIAASAVPHRGWLAGKWAVVVLLLVNMGYVLLDVTNLGVFAGYKQSPGAAYILADQDRTLAFARWSQQLNGRRGLPLFGEARLLEQRLADHPTPLNLNQAEAAYRKSVQADGLNVAVLVNYAMFKQSRQQPQAQHELLERALKVKPYDYYASAGLLQFYVQRGEHDEVQRVARHILKWCKLMSAEPGARQLFASVEQLLQASVGDHERLQSCFREVDRTRGSGRKQTWLMRWAAGKT